MYAVLELRDTQITGEMRQAFKALLRLPPQQYIAPGEDSDAQERESMTYEQLVEQPLFFNTGCGPKYRHARMQPPTLSPEDSDAAASAAHAPYTRLCSAEAAEA